MLTLMILVAATWMGLYLAKRITRPVQMLATAAKEIGAGHLDHRVVPETTDEFGSLIEAFNRMAGELAASRRRLERSSVELEQKHQEVEGRRRYVETILDRIATGVVSVDAAGRIRTANSAASRLLGDRRERRRAAGVGRVRRAGAQAAGDAHRRGVAQPRGRPAAGSRDHARRARAAPGGDDDAAAPRRRRVRRASSSSSTT